MVIFRIVPARPPSSSIEPRLAGTLVPDDLDHPSRAGDDGGEIGLEGLQLGGDPGQREAIRTVVADTVGGADRIGGDRPLLPLDHERRQRGGGEPYRRAIEHVGRGQHLTGGRLGHESCGQVDRIPHHGEGPPERCPDVAGEHRPGVHPDAEAEGKLFGGDLAQCQQHPLLVLTGTPRHARHQDDLAAVVVDVGPEKRHIVLLGRDLHPPDDGVEALGQITRPVFLEDGIRAVEVEERDGRGAVLRFATPLEEMLPDGGGDVAGEVDAIELGGVMGSTGASPGGDRRRYESPLIGPRLRSVRDSAVAVLMTISPAVAVPSAATVLVAAGPATISSRCDPPTMNMWKVPRWTPMEIRRTTRPADVSSRPASRSLARMPTAAWAARVAWSSPLNSRSSASPPNLRRLPPHW